MRTHYVLITLASAALLACTALACTAGSTHDISGSYVCNCDHDLTLTIEPSGNGYSVTVFRARGETGNQTYTYLVPAANRKKYRLWTDAEHSSYFEVTLSSLGLQGFFYDRVKQSVKQITLLRTEQIAGDE